LEGQGVKGHIRSLGFTEVSKGNANVFEVGLTPDEFSSRYKKPLVKSVVDGSAKEKAKQMRNILGLQEIEMIIEQYKVISKCLFVMHY
jgi:chitin synthase